MTISEEKCYKNDPTATLTLIQNVACALHRVDVHTGIETFVHVRRAGEHPCGGTSHSPTTLFTRSSKLAEKSSQIPRLKRF